jgi:hypothetical protein
MLILYQVKYLPRGQNTSFVRQHLAIEVMQMDLLGSMGHATPRIKRILSIIHVASHQGFWHI